MGFLSAWILLRKYVKYRSLSLNSDQQSSLIFACILGVLLGGRLGYVLFYDWHRFISDPLSAIRFWHGGISGMSSHGGFIGVSIALLWFARKNAVSLFALSDILAALTPPGLFFGRIANFINGELCGRITTVPWAVIFPNVDLLPRHPSQLYEAALEGLFLLLYTNLRIRKPLPNGQLAGEFLILYATLRIFIECFRQPDAPLIGFLTRGQFYSLFLLFAGSVVISSARFVARSKSKHPLSS
jgi:phosphatidylglycerol---prolipoprotein diacylglyceryl transferase